MCASKLSLVFKVMRPPSPPPPMYFSANVTVYNNPLYDRNVFLWRHNFTSLFSRTSWCEGGGAGISEHGVLFNGDPLWCIWALSSTGNTCIQQIYVYSVHRIHSPSWNSSPLNTSVFFIIIFLFFCNLQWFFDLFFLIEPPLLLKGQCHEIFCFWFFSWISFPQAPEYTIRAVSNFFENSRRYSQLKVDHRYQRHRWRICHRYQWHRWQICHRYQRHRRQILSPVLLVLLIPAANLPPVSTAPAANCHRYQWHRRQICHRCHWHRWQTMGIISGCRYLKVNLKAKMYICVIGGFNFILFLDIQ